MVNVHNAVRLTPDRLRERVSQRAGRSKALCFVPASGSRSHRAKDARAGSSKVSGARSRVSPRRKGRDAPLAPPQHPADGRSPEELRQANAQRAEQPGRLVRPTAGWRASPGRSGCGGAAAAREPLSPVCRELSPPRMPGGAKRRRTHLSSRPPGEAPSVSVLRPPAQPRRGEAAAGARVLLAKEPRGGGQAFRRRRQLAFKVRRQRATASTPLPRARPRPPMRPRKPSEARPRLSPAAAPPPPPRVRLQSARPRSARSRGGPPPASRGGGRDSAGVGVASAASLPAEEGPAFQAAGEGRAGPGLAAEGFVLGVILTLSPVCCAVLKIGLVGPWSCNSFFSKAFPHIAAQLAMERIRKDPSVTAVHQLDYELFEERCQTWKAIAGFAGSTKHLSAFIGPLNPSYCDTAALLARGWNKAMVSWVCLNDELDNPINHPTFARTLPSSASVLFTVLKYFSWAHVGIVSSKEDLWVDAADKLAGALRSHGLPVAIVTSTGMEAEKVEETWTKIQAAGNIKVLVLCMPSALLGGEAQATFLSKARELGLTDGRYVFVPYDTLFYSLPYGNHSYFLLDNDDTFREAYDAVLTITLQSGERTFYDAFRAAKKKGEITVDLDAEQVTPLFGTIYNAVYLVTKALAKVAQPETSELSGTTLIQHIRNFDFAGFSHRIQVDSKGRPLAKYVILDTDGKGSQLFPTYVLAASSGTIQPLGRAIHFPAGRAPPADSACWFEPDVLCKRDDLYPGLLIVILLLSPPVFLLLFGLYLAYLIRNSNPSRHAVKGSQKLFLTLDDLTFVNTKISRMRLTLDNLSESRSCSEVHSLRSVTHSLSVKSTMLTYETSNVAMYEGDWAWLKKLETGVTSDWRHRATCVLTKMRDLRHENVNPFLGLLSDMGVSVAVMEFCSRGSLQDLLQNTDIKLDWMFKSSLLMDLIKGMKYLHSQDISHGHLKSRNCVVDGRFVLKITDYGYGELLAAQGIRQVQTSAEELLWTAPELLRDPEVHPKGTFKGDVFSFAIILQEVILRGPPYCMLETPAEEIISKLKNPLPVFRPSIPLENTPSGYIQLMKQCWSEVPNRRPTFDKVLEQFKTINKGKQMNIIDSILRMLEKYSSNLEELIRERTEELEMEKQKTEKLLSQILPLSVAETLKTGASVEPEYFEEVTIYFSDIIGFTTMSALCEPIEIVDLLNDLYTLFDAIIGHHDVYKVETIGDAYMVASGLPKRNGHRHAAEIANMSLDILSSVGAFKVKHIPGLPIKIRMGLHSGPCAAGVVGLTMPRYCLFGDTVNTASRIESTGLPYRIHISQNTMKILQNLKEGYRMDFRGKTELKGKGLEDTYWLVGKKGFTKALPHPPEIKPGQPWQEIVTREIKAAMKVSRSKFMDKQSREL
ncbi:retinal guanylyl cyclase 2-like [Candoia aspera]|uniref:retinal guanylyl cyclase 2-like n=1 Tax=Candoia aspera TaxID=51853 RepID=UPI002FD80ABD